jgi:hypothetical protein
MAVVVRRATEDELPWIWRLVHDVYLKAGLIEPQMDGFFSHYPRLDCIPETIPLVAVEDGKRVGTMSLTMDGTRGLPPEDDYPGEMDALRREGHRLASCWRLAVVDGFDVALPLMRSMVDIAVNEFDEPTVAVECHPNHGRFYRGLMGFEQIGERPDTKGLSCAPSWLMVGGHGTYSRLLK